MKSWIDDVNAELERARKKFPNPDFLVTAFSEESGELVKSVLDHMFNVVRNILSDEEYSRIGC